MYLYIMAQADQIQVNEGASVSVLMTIIIGFIVLTIKTLTPVVINYIKNQFENVQKRQNNELINDESETKRTNQTHEIITALGIESLKRKQAHNNDDILIELGELRAKDRLREGEVSLLRGELKDTNIKMEIIREQISKNQNELMVSQVKMVTFEKEVENLKIRGEIIQKEKDILTKEVLEKNNKIEEKEKEIVTLKKRIKSLEEERKVLQERLNVYELILGKEKNDDK